METVELLIYAKMAEKESKKNNKQAGT